MDVLCGIGIKKVACGTQFSVALTKDGNVYTFGQGKLVQTRTHAFYSLLNVKASIALVSYVVGVFFLL